MLTNHVVSRELAEELKAAGWPQERSAFYWVMPYPGSLVLPGPSWELMYHGQLVDYKDGEYLFCAAPLASELMERMPNFVYLVRTHKECRSSFLDDNLEMIGEAAATFPDALAKLALHLIKEGILKP